MDSYFEDREEVETNARYIDHLKQTVKLQERDRDDLFVQLEACKMKLKLIRKVVNENA